MSGELVKWPGNVPATLEKRVELWRRRHAEQGAVDASRLKPVIAGERGKTIYLLSDEGGIIDLPRICAVHDRLWCARYIRNPSGRFEYEMSIDATERVRRLQYAPENARVLPADFRSGGEDCPLCGASTPEGSTGAVLCGQCHARICYGRTSRDGIFRCRASCTGTGKLTPCTEPETGIVPALSRYKNAGR